MPGKGGIEISNVSGTLITETKKNNQSDSRNLSKFPAGTRGTFFLGWALVGVLECTWCSSEHFVSASDPQNSTYSLRIFSHDHTLHNSLQNRTDHVCRRRPTLTWDNSIIQLFRDFHAMRQLGEGGRKGVASRVGHSEKQRYQKTKDAKSIIVLSDEPTDQIIDKDHPLYPPSGMRLRTAKPTLAMSLSVCTRVTPVSFTDFNTVFHLISRVLIRTAESRHSHIFIFFVPLTGNLNSGNVTG